MELIYDVFSKGFIILSLISGVPIVAALVVGLTAGIIQAAFGVQEQTLSFVPKIVIVSLIIFFALPYAFSSLTEYTIEIYNLFSKIKA